MSSSRKNKKFSDILGFCCIIRLLTQGFSLIVEETLRNFCKDQICFCVFSLVVVKHIIWHFFTITRERFSLCMKSQCGGCGSVVFRFCVFRMSWAIFWSYWCVVIGVFGRKFIWPFRETNRGFCGRSSGIYPLGHLWLLPSVHLDNSYIKSFTFLYFISV